MNAVLYFVFMVIIFLSILAMAAGIVALFVMLFWNILASFFGFKAISYLVAWALSCLLLFITNLFKPTVKFTFTAKR
jgi:hypothetical protein